MSPDKDYRTQYEELLNKHKILQAKYDLIENKILEGIIIHDEGTITEVSRSFLEMTGYAREDLIGQSIFSFLHKSSWNEVSARVGKLDELKYQVSIIHKDGSTGDYQANVRNLQINDRTLRITSMSPFTELNDIQKQLQDSLDRYQALLDNSSNFIIIMDKSFIVNYHNQNPGAVRFVGPGFVGRSIFEYLDDTTEKEIRVTAEKMWELEEPQPFEFYLNDGYFLARLIPLPTNEIMVVITDITEIKLVQIALKESEERYRNLIDAAPIGIIATRKAEILFVNNKLLEIFGYDRAEELFGKHIGILQPENVRAEFARLAMKREDGEKIESTYRSIWKKRDGTPVHININSSVVELEGKLSSLDFIEDITEIVRVEKEQERLDQQLSTIQRMESLGVLSSGISHDLNNLLMGIQGYNSLIKHELLVSEKSLEYIERVEDLVETASSLATQLLAYSGKSKSQIKTSNLNTLIKNMSHLIDHSVAKSVEIVYELEEGISLVDIDDIQINQVIMNLVMNANEAIEPEQGKITIRTGNIELTEDDLSEFHYRENVDPGRYVFLEVEDNGVGIQELDLHRIFEPFYTTKFTGRGLGLAVVLGIVKIHKGAIKVVSHGIEGASITIVLPPTENQIEGKEPVDTLSSKLVKPRQTGLVLICEDEQFVMDVTTKYFQILGYETVRATNGEEAVELFKEHHSSLYLVLMDNTMPKMTGIEAYYMMHDINPKVPIILTSGYSVDTMEKKYGHLEFYAILQKPYTIERITQVLRSMDDHRP